MSKKLNLSPSAKVVDGSLILTLPNALSPIVWRMELGTVKSSALEVRAGANDTSVLTLKTPKGDVNDIAAFAAKKDAVDALMSVSKAMENAHGQIAPKASGGEGFHQKLEKSKKKRWILTGIGVLIVLFLFLKLMSVSPTSMPSSSEGGFPSSAATEAARKTVGEPISADDLLGQ